MEGGDCLQWVTPGGQSPGFMECKRRNLRGGCLGVLGGEVGLEYGDEDVAEAGIGQQDTIVLQLSVRVNVGTHIDGQCGYRPAKFAGRKVTGRGHLLAAVSSLICMYIKLYVYIYTGASQCGRSTASPNEFNMY